MKPKKRSRKFIFIKRGFKRLFYRYWPKKRKSLWWHLTTPLASRVLATVEYPKSKTLQSCRNVLRWAKKYHKYLGPSQFTRRFLSVEPLPQYNIRLSRCFFLKTKTRCVAPRYTFCKPSALVPFLGSLKIKYAAASLQRYPRKHLATCSKIDSFLNLYRSSQISSTFLLHYKCSNVKVKNLLSGYAKGAQRLFHNRYNHRLLCSFFFCRSFWRMGSRAFSKYFNNYFKAITTYTDSAQSNHHFMPFSNNYGPQSFFRAKRKLLRRFFGCNLKNKKSGATVRIYTKSKFKQKLKQDTIKLRTGCTSCKIKGLLEKPLKKLSFFEFESHRPKWVFTTVKKIYRKPIPWWLLFYMRLLKRPMLRRPKYVPKVLQSNPKQAPK